MAFYDIFKVLFLPFLIAITLYGLLAYLLLPLYRRHRGRYAQYAPLNSLTTHTSSLRTRLQDSASRYLLPSFMRWRYERDAFRPGGRGRAFGLDDSEEEDEQFFGEQEGESMVGFDLGGQRGRRGQERLPVRSADGRVEGEVEIDSQRRLSRELEEGFKDESDEEGGDDRRR